MADIQESYAEEVLFCPNFGRFATAAGPTAQFPIKFSNPECCLIWLPWSVMTTQENTHSHSYAASELLVNWAEAEHCCVYSIKPGHYSIVAVTSPGNRVALGPRDHARPDRAERTLKKLRPHQPLRIVSDFKGPVVQITGSHHQTQSGGITGLYGYKTSWNHNIQVSFSYWTPSCCGFQLFGLTGTLWHHHWCHLASPKKRLTDVLKYRNKQ